MSTSQETGQKLLEFEGVDTHYGPVHVLKGVDMSPPDRIGNIAASIAAMPRRSQRIQRLARIEQMHGKGVAEQVEERAREIFAATRAARRKPSARSNRSNRSRTR